MGERKGTKGLELWCRRMTEGYPGVNVVNMTTSWRDGLAFCAIIHHFRPDLIEFSKLNKDDIYYNNDLAFRTAERHLGIPALLEPEDMVEFAVPDRLSILTYLSQFYQTFVVSQGKSAARIAAKRAATSPDRSLVSPASSSPPTKVAFPSAGKIRREPCAKCGLPVFIAERLNVGKLLYHRTCFRCARCSSQLTLANYYETENNEFCCETCPDEEKSHFNQPPDASVLTRSLSDEEKSASLKKSVESDDYSANFETALEYPEDVSLKRSSTLTNSQYHEARTLFFGSQVEGASSGDEDEPPDLPKTKPPARAENVTFGESFSDSNFPKDKLETNVNIGSSDSFSKTSSTLEKSHDIVTKDTISAEGNTNSLVKARMRLFETKSDAPNETHSVNNKVPLKSNSAVEVGRNNKEDSKHSFKDNALKKYTSKENLSLRNSPEKEVLGKSPEKEVLRISPEKETPRKSPEKVVVRKSPEKVVLKKSPEKVVLKKSPEKEVLRKSPEKETPRKIPEKEVLRKSPEKEVLRKSPEKETRRKSPEKVVLRKTPEKVVLRKSPEKVVLKKTPEKEVLRQSPEKEISRKSPPKQSQLDIIEIKDDSIITISDTSENTFEDSLRKSENIESIITSSDFSMKSEDTSAENKPSPEPLDETLPVIEISDDLSKHDEIACEKPEENKVVHQNQLHVVRESPEEVKPQIAEVKFSPNIIYQTSFLSATTEESVKDEDKDDTNEYPDDLNPFGDDEDGEPEKPAKKVGNVSLNPFDDEEDETVVSPSPKPAARRKIKPLLADTTLSPVYIQRISINPFEEDEDVNEKTVPHSATRRVIAAPRVSLNPFWSDDEEEENDETKPVPKPRLSKTPGAPEPKPRESGLSSSTNFGSSSSVTSSQGGYTLKKKKPAPRPPLFNGTESGPSSLTSSPCQSVTHSPRSTPKIRKARKAPLPPTSTPIDGLSVPLDIDEATLLGDDFENEKIAKDEQNRNRQSQTISLQSPSSSENSSSLSVPNKSTHGKWKRKKGQAPSRPIPQRRNTKSLPLIEVRRELEIIEIQQQGLEKQGVRLEQIIRERCEGPGVSPDDSLAPEIEEMVLQLFELVNEKNELFRRQAELMYLRRQQKLEEEHADIEYQIRCLMLQPEANKTDSDKAREEELINRLVEIVERRNEIIECLEMDRVREAEEDDSINNQLNLYTLKKEEDKAADSKSAKKEKKKHKKEKKSKLKGPKVDADKDIDESEGSTSSVKDKKKKKFNLF